MIRAFNLLYNMEVLKPKGTREIPTNQLRLAGFFLLLIKESNEYGATGAIGTPKFV
jgi:hypothetical protein